MQRGSEAVSDGRRESPRVGCIQRRWRAVLRVSLVTPCLLLVGDLPSLRAGTFSIEFVEQVDGEILLSHPADPTTYYQLQESADASEWQTSAVRWGPAHAWAGPAGETPDHRLLRVRQVPRAAPDDVDEDGLDDVQELLSNTNPLDPDSDGDGLQDGLEQAQHTDPLNGDTASPMVTLTCPASGTTSIRIP